MPRRPATPSLYLPTDREMLALRRDTAEELTFEPHLLVRATALGSWAGDKVLDAISRVRGELGDPHLPFLPDFPQRGYLASVQARTLATLEGLTADSTASGWRVTDGYARESALARTLLESDINALADVVGREKGGPGGEVKLRFLGPVSLAASSYLTSGELILSDAGARRDLRDSFVAGLGRILGLVGEAVPGAGLVVQLDEPLLVRAARGLVSTSSGYRRIPAVPRHELVETLALLEEGLEALGASLVVRCDLLALDAEVRGRVSHPWLNPTGLDTRGWEPLAQLLEAGRKLTLELVSPSHRQPVGELARSLWRTWRDLGLAPALVGSLTLSDTPGLEALNPDTATTVLGHIVEVGRALSEIAQEA